jgi:DNA-binding PadR family transcriptional regulator
MLPGRIDDALLDVLVTPADAREIRARLKTRRSRVTEDELSVALRRLRDQGLVQRWITSGPPRRRTRRYELTWQGVRRVMAQPPRHEAAKSTAPPAAERRLMAERIRQCARLSQAAARLRAAGEAARSR